MSSAIGIKGQPSRFAILRKELDSDDEIELDAKSGAQHIKGANKFKKGESSALKNAKKRARKKKNQSRGNQQEEEVHEVGKKSSGLFQPCCL